MNNQDKWPVEIPGEEKPLETASTVPDTDKRSKYTQFAAGFLGWFLINGAFWFLLFGSDGVDQYEILINACLIPVNIIVLVLSGRNQSTRPISQGVLTAWSVNLILSLVMGLSMNGVCLVPFFIPAE